MSRAQQRLTPNLNEAAYLDMVLNIPDLLAFWLLSEASGTTAEDSTANGYDGAYHTSGVTYGVTGPGSGNKGITLASPGRVNCYSAGLAGDFTPNTLTICGWVKIGGTEWADSTLRVAAHFGENNTTDYLHIRKSTTLDQVQAVHEGGGTVSAASYTFPSQEIDWFHLGATVSAANDRLRLYVDGTQQGADVNSLGTYVGGLGNPFGAIGSQRGDAGSLPFVGSLYGVAVIGREATAAEMARLANING